MLGSVVLAMASLVALLPKPVGITGAHDIAIGNLDALPDGVPHEIVVPELRGLDVVARQLRRSALGTTPGVPVMGTRATREGDLHVFLVRDDGNVRGFIGLDPRNSCPLDVMKVTKDSRVPPSITVFHDVCHGSLYDVNGNHYGGPSPWTLDQLVLSVRNGVVYADLHDVIAGRYIYPR